MHSLCKPRASASRHVGASFFDRRSDLGRKGADAHGLDHELSGESCRPSLKALEMFFALGFLWARLVLLPIAFLHQLA